MLRFYKVVDSGVVSGSGAVVSLENAVPGKYLFVAQDNYAIVDPGNRKFDQDKQGVYIPRDEILSLLIPKSGKASAYVPAGAQLRWARVEDDQ